MRPIGQPERRRVSGLNLRSDLRLPGTIESSSPTYSPLVEKKAPKRLTAGPVSTSSVMGKSPML